MGLEKLRHMGMDFLTPQEEKLMGSTPELHDNHYIPHAVVMGYPIETVNSIRQVARTFLATAGNFIDAKGEHPERDEKYNMYTDVLLAPLNEKGETIADPMHPDPRFSIRPESKEYYWVREELR